MKIFAITTYLFIISLNILYSQNIQRIATSTLNGTVSIYMLDKSNQVQSLGSGAIIGDNLIVTNFHVIDGANSGYIKLNNNDTKFNIKGYTAIDKENDLVLLMVDNVPFTGMKLNTNQVQIGDKIFVAGNPQGLAGTFSDGIVSAKRKIENKDLIQITAPISPGSSGGPVVNIAGEIIGIAVGAYTNGQNLNFAIPSNYIKRLLNGQTEIRPISTLYRRPNLTNARSTVSVQGIEIRHIIWGRDEYAHNNDYEQIHEFSVKNNTEYTIGRIHLMLLVYDNTNTMVDFAEAIFINDLSYNSLIIPPNMAKTVNARSSMKINSKFRASGPPFRKRKIYKWELRILDYEVIK